MASTRFYLAATTTPSISPAFSASWNSTATMIRRQLSTIHGPNTHSTQSVSETSATSPYNVGLRQYVSFPINTASAITGNIKLQMMCKEVSTNADAHIAIIIRRFDSTGATDRGTMLALTVGATEFATSVTNRALTAALSSVSGSVGDVLVIDIGIQFQNSTTTAQTASLEFGRNWIDDLPENETFGAGLATGGTPWIEFDSAIPMVTTEVQSFYLGAAGTSNLAFPTTPATPQAGTTFDGGTFSPGLFARRDRPTPLSNGKTISVTGGGLGTETFWRGEGQVTNKLAKQTVGAGNWVIQYNCKLSTLGADAQGFRCHLFVLKSDGTIRSTIGSSSPVDIASTSNVNRSVTIAASAVSIENGDAILLETEGYDAGSAATYTISLNRGVTSFLKPPATLLLGVAGPEFNAPDEFPMAGYSNILYNVFTAQNSPTRTSTIVLRVKNTSGSTTGNVQAAIYSVSEVSGADNPGTLILNSSSVSVAAGFDGFKTITIDTSGLVVGQKYIMAIAYDDVSIMSDFYYANTDPTRRGGAWTASFGTWANNPTTDFYYEGFPDSVYLSFQEEAASRIPVSGVAISGGASMSF